MHNRDKQGFRVVDIQIDWSTAQANRVNGLFVWYEGGDDYVPKKEFEDRFPVRWETFRERLNCKMPIVKAACMPSMTRADLGQGKKSRQSLENRVACSAWDKAARMV